MLLAFLPGLGPMELTVLLILGVILFGRRLPDVGRYLGKGIMEFKKGMKGLEDDVDPTANVRHEPAAGACCSSLSGSSSPSRAGS